MHAMPAIIPRLPPKSGWGYVSAERFALSKADPAKQREHAIGLRVGDVVEHAGKRCTVLRIIGMRSADKFRDGVIVNRYVEGESRIELHVRLASGLFRYRPWSS
jgi:hypothetical protein